MAAPRATVVLPVKNGAGHLSALLPALRRQVLEGGLEVLAIDSGSDDGSDALLEKSGVRTLRIPPASFDHGETRNLGVREAGGASVVFLTQDALPADDHVVRRLVERIEAEPRVAGAFARQVPRDDADPLTRRDLLGWVACQPEPRLAHVADTAAFEAMPPLQKYRLSAFDNVASAARRGLLLAHPFRATRFGEDVEWGLRMLRAGHGLAYVPEAVVVHSHARSARALYRRAYLGHRLLYRLFGLRTVPDAAHLARAAAATALADVALLVRTGAGLRTLVAAPAQSWAGVYGQYRGARDEHRGRPYPDWAGAGR
jgi:rhamnosyltransferase